ICDGLLRILPRCALESGTSAEPRIDRIVNAMTNSKYSIHDLSLIKHSWLGRSGSSSALTLIRFVRVAFFKDWLGKTRMQGGKVTQTWTDSTCRSNWAWH